MSPWCLAFDLDDTLYLERDYVRSGFECVGQWAAKWLGIPDFRDRAWRLFEQGHRGDIFDCVMRQAGSDPRHALIEHLVWLYRTHVPAITLLPDAAEFLETLDGSTGAAVITDGPMTSQSLKVEALGLDRIATPVVLTDRWGAEFAKPHVRAFEHVQEFWRDRAAKFVYVGDNPVKDFTGPKALGWTTVRVRRPGGIHCAVENLETCRPDFDVSDMLALPAILGLQQRGCARVGVT